MNAGLHTRLLGASLLLVAGTLAAQDSERSVALKQEALRHMDARVFDMGLDRDHSFVARTSQGDELGETHVRMDQHFKGVKVFGGESIVHLRNGEVREVTDALHRGLRLNTNPSIDASEALASAHRELAPKGAYASDPTAELVVARVERTITRPGRFGEDVTRTITSPALVYHVHTELENGAEETAHTDFFIDAHSGEVLKSWSTLHTAGATGTGKSQYNGNVSLSTNSVASGFELRDTVRSMTFTTRNLNHATSGTGTIYTDADNTWGDNANYVEGSSTTAANGQTAAVDAHFGSMKSFDYYKNVHGRNGIDGTGRATYNRVHYSNSYDNAFWSDTCFCMTYGDGSAFTTLTAIDVAGHEMTHGVTANSARLVYSGESGGLNESMSDIFGTCIEFYSRGGTGGNYTIGEQLRSTPLRYMIKPSKDGRSKDAWSSSLGSLDVHYSSGPMNRAFYFMSEGASSSSSSDAFSSFLPGGMAGIGRAKAEKIVYRALTTYMTSSTNYAAAKTACQNAARDLYGAGSAEQTAVTNAFKAINR
jgi:zinc metalloprotease ZmpA